MSYGFSTIVKSELSYPSIVIYDKFYFDRSYCRWGQFQILLCTREENIMNQTWFKLV